MSVQSWTIPETTPAMTLEKYVLRTLPELPAWVVREAFSRRDVKMDGVRVPASTMIRPGALLQVYGIEKKTKPPLNVIYEDNHILLINKPSNISVTDDGTGGTTVEDWALVHVRSMGENAFLPKACHRLDHKTSGLLLLAKTAAAEEILVKSFRERSMEKHYVCLVKGNPNPQEKILKAYLIKDADAAKVKVFSHPVSGGLPIQTGYRVLQGGNVSRLEVDLITGRTHQIRAHLAYIGHPVLGDDVYGDRAFNREQHAKRLMLCATHITLHGEGVLSYLDGKTFSIMPPF